MSYNKNKRGKYPRLLYLNVENHYLNQEYSVYG